MNLEYLAFTARGMELAAALARALGGTPARCGAPEGLAGWTARAFRQAEGLVFVGAAGIAVRAIAPHVRSKAADPAVVVVDEAGRFAIPLLSGHLGGANDLARRIAALLGGQAVLTTATDVRGAFAVDAWARHQGCAVVNPAAIRRVSAKLLAGQAIALRTDWPPAGEPPPGVLLAQGADCDVRVTLRPGQTDALVLVPRIAALGVGCRRGTPQAALEAAFSALLARGDLRPQAVRKACSLDRKQDEPGLLAFCRAHGFPLETFGAPALRAVPGDFAASPFVERVTGVDNVCERSAVLGSGGEILVKKQAGNGVTMALALAPYSPDWRWKDE